MPMIAFVIFAVLAGIVLQRSNAVRTAVWNALTGTYDAAETVVLNTAYYTLAAIRIGAWVVCGYTGLLVCAMLTGNQWFTLAVLGLGLIAAFVSMFVLSLLRLPVAEIATRLKAGGAALTKVPLAIPVPVPLNPATATGAKMWLGIPLSILLALASGVWIFPAMMLVACGGILNALGALAELAEATMRVLARGFAVVAMGLLFFTTLAAIDASLGSHIFDLATLAILTGLFMLGTIISVLATDKFGKFGQNAGVPWSAVWIGLLTGGLLLALLYAHIDPTGAREVARAFRNSSDTAKTFARIGNDQGQITRHAYWRTRSDTVLRPCPGCTAAGGTVNGQVSDYLVEVKANTPLASLRTEEPVELDGVLWLRVFRPYREDRPSLGFHLGPMAAWLAPKDHLDGDVRPENPEPRAPLLTTMKGMPAKLMALAPLMLFSGFLLLPVIVWGGTRALGRVFNRPNAAAAGAGTAVASTAASSEGTIPWLVIGGALLIPLLYVLTPVIMLAMGIWADQNIGNPVPPQSAMWLALPHVLDNLWWVVLLGTIVLLVFKSRRLTTLGWGLAILLGLWFLQSKSADIASELLRAYQSTLRGPTAVSIQPTPANAENFARYLPLVDAELARYPQLAPHRNMVLALVRQESDWNPRAVSPKGAVGLMQLMPNTTARTYGVSDPFNAEQNVRGGLAFLSDLYSRYGGQWPLILAAYNWGPDRVPVGADAGQLLAAAPEETRKHVAAVQARAAGRMPDNPGGGAFTAYAQTLPARPSEARAGVRREDSRWLITAPANQATPLGISLEPGRYQVTVASPPGGCPTWDPFLRPVCPDDRTGLAGELSEPGDFPLPTLGVGKPVILTDQGKVGLASSSNSLEASAPMTLKSVVPNDRERHWGDNRGSWDITIRKEG